MSGLLRGFDGDGDDGRCAECESRIAAGPCAACESMICADCGVMSRDPAGQRVICISCARLIAQVDARPRRRPPPIKWLALALIVIFGAGAVFLLSG